MTADLVARLEAAAENWPTVYESDRANIALLREAASALRSSGEAVEYEFEVWQDDSMQAGGSTTDFATAKDEADHYAMMYGQDGPVEVKFYERREVTPPTSTKGG